MESLGVEGRGQGGARASKAHRAGRTGPGCSRAGGIARPRAWCRVPDRGEGPWSTSRTLEQTSETDSHIQATDGDAEVQNRESAQKGLPVTAERGVSPRWADSPSGVCSSAPSP